MQRLGISVWTSRPERADGGNTANAGPETKVYHSRYERVVLQESSPQNNFRRIIAARLAAGNYCNHTINYTTSQHSVIDLSLILFVLNSAFAEWYFRLGSTNAHVSQYQLKMIPCPRFGHGDRALDQIELDAVMTAVASADFDTAEALSIALAERGCGATIEALITALIGFIEDQERARGVITRAQRAHLSAHAQRAQVILDKIMMTLIGLGNYYTQIRERLALML